MDQKILCRRLISAALESDYAGLRELIREGADPNYRSHEGYTPLHITVIHGHTRSAACLLEGGADPDLRFPQGYPPMSEAIAQNDEAMIRLLAEQGADIFLKPDGRHSYLDEAYTGRIGPRFRAAVALQDIGLSILNSTIAAVDNTARFWICWEAPAIVSAWKGDREKLRRCLEEGVDPNIVGDEPLLLTAANRGNLAIIRLLIEKGADVNQVDGANKTALMAAARHGFIEIIKELIHHGADVNKQMKSGRTALDWAIGGKQKNSDEVCHYLIALGARSEYSDAGS